MRYLSIFTLLVASSSLASAAFITGFCTPTPGSGPVGTFAGGTGTVSYACGGSGAVAAGFQVIAGSLTLQTDYQFGSGGLNTFQVSIPVPGYTANPLVAVTSATGSSSGASTAVTSTLNGTPLGSGVSVAAFVVTGTGSMTSGSVATGSGLLSYSYTVEAVQNTGGVPEPSTLALVGGVLVLAGIRKFRS